MLDVLISLEFTESMPVVFGDNGEDTLDTICCCFPLRLVAGNCLNLFLTNALDRLVDVLSVLVLKSKVVAPLYPLLVGVLLLTIIIPGCACC